MSGLATGGAQPVVGSDVMQNPQTGTYSPMSSQQIMWRDLLGVMGSMVGADNAATQAQHYNNTMKKMLDDISR